MSKIKGRYVATIIFNFDYDDANEADIRPFDEIQSDLKNGKLTKEIRRSLMDCVFDDSTGTLTVEQQYADLYKLVEEEKAEELSRCPVCCTIPDVSMETFTNGFVAQCKCGTYPRRKASNGRPLFLFESEQEVISAWNSRCAMFSVWWGEMDGDMF